MKHPFFHIKERATIARAPSFPELVGEECDIIGGLMRRPYYDTNANLAGYIDAYLVKILRTGLEICAPEPCLRKRWLRSDWASLKCDWYGKTRQIWRPKREAR